VVVNADGHRLRTRTRGKSVGDALVDLGLYVAGSDRVTPPLDSRLTDNVEIAVTRVRESVLVEREVIPYESIMVADDTLEIDHKRLAQQGQDGEFRTRYQLVEEDGVEVKRQMTDAWVAAEPVTLMTAFGRQLVSRPLDTPEGPVTYWRKIRMYATSYSPARSGTPKSAPWYGRTRLGQNLRKGIVAVDTSVIPLRSRVYVPGYGIAIAGDTGGGVRGKWIDLGFEDRDYESWHRWVDVYVLDPPPAARQIRWVLPNYPPPGFPNKR
jgi:3D (Asp-Asp-Asp) domain-containing protein